MKKLAFLMALAMTVALLLSSCGKTVDMVMRDGEHYRNPNIEIEYVSSEVVRVTFTADVYAERATVRANVVLVSEGSVVGQCELVLRPGVGTDHPGCSVSQDVSLSYHNYGAITAYVDSINAFYTQYE